MSILSGEFMYCSKVILLNQKYWYVKLYLWSVRRWNNFNGTHQFGDNGMTTDLCSFIKTIMVKLPIVIFSYAIALLMVLISLVIIPSYIYGAHQILFWYSVCGILFLIGHIIAETFKYIRSFFVVLKEMEQEPEDDLTIESIVDSYQSNSPTISFPDIIKMSIRDYLDDTKITIMIEN